MYRSEILCDISFVPVLQVSVRVNQKLSENNRKILIKNYKIDKYWNRVSNCIYKLIKFFSLSKIIGFLKSFYKHSTEAGKYMFSRTSDNASSSDIIEGYEVIPNTPVLELMILELKANIFLG